MKKGKRFLTYLLLIFSPCLLLSSPADTTSIIDNIYNFNFNKAKEQLSLIDNSDDLIIETLNLERTWWMAIESGYNTQFSDFLGKLNEFEKVDYNNLGEIISTTYRMRYYACENKFLRLPLLLMKVKNDIEKVDIAELNSEEYELFILYKSFLTLLENSYSVEKFSPDYKGKQKLIRNIEDVISYGTLPNKTIGRYFLMKYYLEIEKNRPKAIGYLVELHNQYPQNIIFTQLLTNK